MGPASALPPTMRGVAVRVEFEKLPRPMEPKKLARGHGREVPLEGGGEVVCRYTLKKTGYSSIFLSAITYRRRRVNMQGQIVASLRKMYMYIL